MLIPRHIEEALRLTYASRMRSAGRHLDQLICFGILSCLIPNPCFALKFPNYPVRAASDYSVNAEQGSLTIGVQVLDDLDEQKTYFQTKLSPKGFLPVFVVIQNAAAAQDSYIFDKTKVSIPSAATNATPQASSKAAMGTMLASVAAGSLVGSMIALKMAADTSEISEELLLKELRSTTLSPGVSVRGFLYIPIPKKGDREKVHLKIPMLKSGSEEAVDLELVF